MATQPPLFIPTNQQDSQNFQLKCNAALTVDMIEYFQLYCTAWTLPGIGTRSAAVSTPFATVKYVGDKLQFGPLYVEFLVREDLSNYLTMQGWLRKIGRPNSFDDWTSNHLLYSDLTMFMYDAQNIVTNQFKFRNASPIYLGDLQFSTTDSTDLKAIAVFDYDLWDLDSSITT